MVSPVVPARQGRRDTIPAIDTSTADDSPQDPPIDSPGPTGHGLMKKFDEASLPEHSHSNHLRGDCGHLTEVRNIDIAKVEKVVPMARPGGLTGQGNDERGSPFSAASSPGPVDGVASNCDGNLRFKSPQVLRSTRCWPGVKALCKSPWGG